MPKTRKLADLELLEGGGAGGMGGGVGKSMLKEAAGAAGIAAGLYGVGKADRYMTKLGDERRKEEQREAAAEKKREVNRMDKGEAVKYRHGGAVSASKRADGIAQRGKTRGKMC